MDLQQRLPGAVTQHLQRSIVAIKKPAIIDNQHGIAGVFKQCSILILAYLVHCAACHRQSAKATHTSGSESEHRFITGIWHLAVISNPKKNYQPSGL